MAALDPFHDNRLDNLSGYPDTVTTSSIIRQVKQSLEITTPASEDVYIVNWPWLGPVTMNNYSVDGNSISLPGLGAFVVPSLSVYRVTAGSNLDISVAPTLGLTYPRSMHRGRGRLVGCGLELVNTTAPINRSGTLYGWRLPGLEEQNETFMYLTAAGVIQRAGAIRETRTPPRNPAQAMLIPGTRSWAAEEGAYLVVPLESDNPPLLPTQTGTMVTIPPNGDLEVGLTNPRAVIATQAGVATGLANRLVPVNLTGIMCTGNNPNSKFTLNVIWYYEEFPSVESDVLTLSTPSCEHDPVALECYTRVLNTLPIMVPSSWNAAGDWWWDVVTAIKDYAPEIGGMIGGAPGKLLGTAASQLAGWGRDRYLTSPGSGGSSVPERQRQRKPNQKKKNPQQQGKQNNANNQKQKSANARGKEKAKNQGGRPPPLPPRTYLAKYD